MCCSPRSIGKGESNTVFCETVLSLYEPLAGILSHWTHLLQLFTGQMSGGSWLHFCGMHTLATSGRWIRKDLLYLCLQSSVRWSRQVFGLSFKNISVSLKIKLWIVSQNRGPVWKYATGSLFLVGNANAWGKLQERSYVMGVGGTLYQSIINV